MSDEFGITLTWDDHWDQVKRMLDQQREQLRIVKVLGRNKSYMSVLPILDIKYTPEGVIVTVGNS